MHKSAEYIRAVQLDLARQPESLAFIESFIDLMAANHYNTLFLYLEWRIRTAVFDPGEDQGYSAGELRKIIGYAGSKGISVIPGLACLGHSELLLSHPEFSSCSELREGITGRFGGSRAMDLCPSLEETRRILKEYITEAAEIFRESPYIHVGGDEVNDMARCSLCRERAKDYAGEQRIYLEHFQYVHEVVSGLGRRMMLWDDMFELYPDSLAEMPRDTVLVCWQYQDNVRGYLGHFNHSGFDDRRLALYEKLGFDYMLGPVDHTWSNIFTTASYGRLSHPMGTLLTSWEKRTSLLLRFLPNMAAAGCLMMHPDQNPDEVFREAAARFFGIQEEDFLNALAEYGNLVDHFPSVSLQTLTTFDFFGPEYLHLAAHRTVLAVVQKYSARAGNGLAGAVLEDIMGDCRLKILAARCRRACWNLFHGMAGESLEQLGEELEQESRSYSGLILRHRRPCDLAAFEKLISRWRQALSEVSEGLRAGRKLTVLFALPDGYGAQFFRFRVNGVEVASGCYKKLGAPFFEVFFFIPGEDPVREITVESWGYGGQGVAYVSADLGSRRYVPAEIAEVSGVVEHPEAMLIPDTEEAFFGTADILAAYAERTPAEAVHQVRLRMKPAE